MGLNINWKKSLSVLALVLLIWNFVVVNSFNGFGFHFDSGDISLLFVIIVLIILVFRNVDSNVKKK